MTSERIKEIQEGTAYPNSLSVKQALLQVWNECEQHNNKEDNSIIIEMLQSKIKDNEGTMEEYIQELDNEEGADMLQGENNAYEEVIELLKTN